jgi:hypothetical protein
MTVRAADRRCGGHRFVRGLTATALAALSVLSACASTSSNVPGAPGTASAAIAPAAPTLPPPAPAVQFRTAAESRPALLASISIPSIDRLLGSGTALVGRAVPLPLDAISVRDMLLSQAGLSPTVGENLDFSSPAGVAVVAMGPGTDAGVVMAIPAKGAAQAKQVLAALGKTLSKRGEVSEVSNGAGGKGWIWMSGSVLVLSDSLDALVKGAALAMEARRPAPEDVTAVLFPDAIAAANGTDVKTALAKMINVARAAQAAQGMAMNLDSVSLFSDVLGLVADTSTFEIGLAVDTTRGVSIRTRMNAKPGSKLAAVSEETHPVAFDPLLFSGGKDVTLLVGATTGPLFRAHIARLRQRLQNSKEAGAAAALAFFDATVDAVAGMGAVSGYLRPELDFRAIFPLKDANAAGKVNAALKHLDQKAALALVKSQMEGTKVLFDWSVKKETVGKLTALHYSMSPNLKSDLPGLRDFWKKFFGRSLDIYSAVSGSRFIATGGKKAKADLLALDAGKGAEPSGEAARAIAAAKGKDLLEYFDFGPLVATIAALSNDPRAALLAKGTQASIPLALTAGGDGKGQVTTFELNIPPAAFSGVGTLLQGLNTAARK